MSQTSLQTLSDKRCYMRFLFCLFLACGWASVLSAQTQPPGPVCPAAAPFCADPSTPVTYPASSGGSSTGSYGCLSTAPNPGWFYFQSNNNGDPTTFVLSNSASIDIDFALWGPYPSYGAAIGACGGLTGTPPIDCSYSTAAVETVSAPPSAPGSFFLLLITNFNGAPTSITVQTTSGGTNCGLLTCQANAGSLSGNQYQFCFLDPGLANITENPTYAGSPPDPAEFTQGYVVFLNGSAVAVTTNPDYTQLAVGDYTICPYSYLTNDATLATIAILGQSNTSIQTLLADPNVPFCANLGTDCFDLSIGPPQLPNPPQTITTCLGEDWTGPDGNTYPGSGTVDITFSSYLGCDSVITFILVPEVIVSVPEIVSTCLGQDWIGPDGNSYPSTGTVNITFPTPSGCDSVQTYVLTPEPVVVPPVLVETCLGEDWIGPDGNTYPSPGSVDITLPATGGGCDTIQTYLLVPIAPGFSQLDTVVCQGQTFTYNGTDYGIGAYDITLVGPNGCDSLVVLVVDSIEVQANIISTADTINCIVTSATLSNDGAADSYEWQDASGTVVGTDPSYTTSEGGCYTLVVTSSQNGQTCTDTDTYCLAETGENPQPPTVIWNNPDACFGENLDLTGMAPGASGCVWTAPNDNCVQIVSGQNTPTVSVDVSSCTTDSITLCVVVSNDCGDSDPGCLTIAVPTEITVDAGADAAVCDPSYTLQGDTDGQPANWTTVSGPGTATFGDAGDPGSSVSVDQPGTYLFELATAGNCSATDQVSITFNEDPQLDTPAAVSCDATNTNYVVTFSVTGGSPPYTAAGGSFSGGAFTSDPIASGSTYSFSVTDSEGCGPVEVSGMHSCDCTTAAGTMSGTALAACEDDTVTATHNGDATLDGNDGFAYFLHDNAGTGLGTVLAENATGTFGFQAGMSYGQPYYISYAAADVQGGGIDLSDPCLSVAAGQPVTFYENPVVDAGADDSVCALDYALSASATVGAGAWSLVFGVGTANFADATSPATTVTVDTHGSYTFAYTADNNGCAATDEVVIAFNESPYLVPGSLQEICDATNTSYTVTFTVNGGQIPYASAGGTFNINGFTSGPILSGDPYSFVITDANGCASVEITGSATCDCATDAGTMSGTALAACEDDTVTATHNGDATLDGNDGFAYFLHDNAGTGLGTVLAENATGTFGFQAGMSYGQPYYISYAAADVQGGGIDLSDPCLSVAAGQPVTFYQNPTAAAGADATVCGLEYVLAGGADAGTLAWSQTSGPGAASFDNVGAGGSAVTVTEHGVYVFALAADNNGCTDTDEVTIAFADTPSAVDLNEVCDATNTSYVVTFTIQGGTAPYAVTGGPGTTSAGAFTSDPLPSGTAYSFELTDANGCGPVVVSGSRTCDCATDAGTMSATALAACEDDTVTATHNGDATLDGNDGFVYFLHDNAGTALGDVLAENATGVFGFQAGMSYGQPYYISYAVADAQGGGIDLDDDCLSVAPGQPVIFYENPTADAGADATTCGLTYSLTGGSDVGAGTWSATVGTFDDPTDPAATVTVSSSGTYTFVYTADNNGCTDTDEVVITFAEGPALDGAVGETCDAVTLQYTVVFALTGGTAPYTVAGAGSLNGDTFTSDPIDSGVAYSFEVTDANGCGPLVVSGSRNCNCLTNAGSMDLDPIELCADEVATAAPTAGSVLDANDALHYYLHDGAGSALGTVFADSDAPSFALPAGASTGVTYFISAVAGDAQGAGIDLDDDCLSVAAGTPVVWQALPTVSLSQNGPVCTGGTAQLSFAFSGNGPFDVAFADGTTYTGLSSGTTVDVSPSATTTYTLVSVTSADGCSSAVGDGATVVVNEPPTATVTNTVTTCNATDNGNSTTVDFAALLTAGDTSGSFSNDDGVGTGSFPVLDFTGVAPGSYAFTYTTAAAQAPCENVSYGITVIVEDCLCPSVATASAAPLCNDGGSIDLGTLQVTDQAGNWTATGAPSGVDLPTLAGTLFDATGLPGGDYVFTFTLEATPPAGCATGSSQTVTVEQAVSAGTALQNVVVCADEGLVLDLNAQLNDADTGGSWSLNGNATGYNGGSSFNTTQAGPGTYTFVYAVAGVAPCADDQAQFSVFVNAPPVADAGADQTGTCDEPLVTLGGASSTGPNIRYSWRAENGPFPGDSTLLNPQIGLPGVYYLTVINDETGCTATDQVEITANQDVPVPDISLRPVSCFGEADGAIIIQGVTGGVPPYVFSLDGSPFSQAGVYTGLAPASYDLVVEDANGCTNEFKIDITQPQELDVSIVVFLDDDNTIRLGDSVQIAAQTSLPADSIDAVAWTPPGVLSCDTCLTTIAQPLETTLFTVTVESNGCSDSDALTIFVNRERLTYAPTAFSPNGEGGNEVFFVFFDEQVEAVEEFVVFNRWGEPVYQVFETPPNDPQFGWDGRFRGEMLNPGVFVWYTQVRYRDGSTEVYSGDITLMK